MRGRLAALAAAAPIPVFPVTGSGARHEVSALRLRPELEVVDTPRHAGVLLVAGTFRPGEVPGLAAVHDQISPPRATVRWGEAMDDLVVSRQLSGDADMVVAAITALGREVSEEPGRSEPPLLPDVDPVEWRGVGPYGHGGKGMTGGTPFGRPLAERAPDRDGVELDQLPLTVGPWAGPLPPGLAIDLKLQGDIIQEAEIREPVMEPSLPGLFAEALGSPQRVADLELARASHHLFWLGEALRVHGLQALGLRAIRLALGVAPGSERSVRRLLTMVRRSAIFSLALERVGAIPDSGPSGLGPVDRARGRADDARVGEAAYDELGFGPITYEAGDSASRWRQRLAEIEQSLDLAARAGDLTAFGNGVVESPRGRIALDAKPPSSVVLAELGDWMAGMEWGDAVTLIWSLDVDPGARIPAGAGVGE